MFEGIRHNHAKRRRTLWVVAAGLAIVVFAVMASFLFVQSKDKDSQKQQTNQAASERIVAKVGQLYELPNNETPTVAQVQDKTKLTGQQFFIHAENEDYILVYTKAKLALLYREKTNKLVNVGPVNIDGQGVAGENTQEPNQ